jgi:DNA-binding NtrC family response regulator
MTEQTILVADDDAAIRTVLSQALTRLGYTVRSTGNAATLWHWISDGSGDLVISDVVMPDESAFDLLPRIKKLRADLPVIVMSAQNTIMTAITATERGAYEYLPKPFDLNELTAVVARALDQSKRRVRVTDIDDETARLPLIGRSAAMFLDEIGDMPMDAQTRLLRVLQEGEFARVGGTAAVRANVRIVAATHRDLRQHIDQGLFREDLYYRLNVVPIRLPPLRERSEDIADLVRFFLDAGQREGLPVKQFEAPAMRRLRDHKWPGNVRELENLVRRLAALYSDETINVAMVEAELSEAPDFEHTVSTPGSLGEYTESYLSEYFGEFNESLPPPGLYNRVLAQVEVPLINAALAATAGNQIRAAELLGINRNTLRKKIRDHNITVIRGLSLRSENRS